MADIVDKQTRSRMMSRIRGRDTIPEVALRRSLHRKGFRFRLHSRRLPGKPDLVLAKYNAVVFVHGCFWHRHAGCRFTTTPASNIDFWREKFSNTVKRDALTCEMLRSEGWRIATVWECSLRKAMLDVSSRLLTDWLTGVQPEIEIPLK